MYFIKKNKRKKIILNKKQIIFKTIIPPKYENSILKFYHYNNGHKGYLYLGRDIINAGFYFEQLYLKCNNYIKNCHICIPNKKNIFHKPALIQILTKGPKEVYQLDITDIPEKLKKDDTTNYLLCIIDQFSKYGLAYIIQNKKAENILNYLKDFIVKNGIPRKIHTDNGKELLINY